MIFNVWAPNAKCVDLLVDEQRIALEPMADGYWQIDAVVDERRGYRYSIDRAAPLPDPRSRWQPEGVHGASHIVDAASLDGAARRQTDFRAVPLNEAILYELHVGTFTAEGTYAAAQAKLPHLVELGVTHLELMPLAT
ncbi:MAG TPA: hypothetical protein VGD54_19885, partial [Steroidobacteraceae bacterium]